MYFTTTKILNKQQIRWAKMLEKYKFIIYYMPEKNNDKINTLNRRLDLIKKNKKYIRY